MKELEMIKKRKYLFLALGFIIAIAIGWIYLINPAAELKDASFDEIYIYSNNDLSLWELGFIPEDFKEVTGEHGYFEYSALFNGEAFESAKYALQEYGRSYYLFGEPKNQDNIYTINIPINNEEGFTFLVPPSIVKEANGRFIGYKYSKNDNDTKWIGYNNPKLGEALLELRIKNLDFN